MQAHVPHVVGITAARLEIGLVGVERFGDGQRTAFVDGCAGRPPAEGAGSVERLPIRKAVRRARAFEIISERDLLSPLGTAVGHPHGPCACPGVAAVAERDAGREPDVIRLLPQRELAAGRGTFELGIAWFGQRPVSGLCPEYRSGAPWSAIQRCVVKGRYCVVLSTPQWSRMECYGGNICHDAGRSPLGAPPWRFWAPGAALPSPSAPAVLQRRAGATPVRAASSSPPGRSAWRAGALPPEASGYEQPPQDATPHSAFRIGSRTRPP